MSELVEGARLESEYMGNRIEGSNPSLSATAVIDGELAMPCNLRFATAGLNSHQRVHIVQSAPSV